MRRFLAGVVVGVSTLILVMANRPAAGFTIGIPFVWMVLLPGKTAYLTLWPRSVLAAVTVMGGLLGMLIGLATVVWQRGRSGGRCKAFIRRPHGL